MIIFFIFLYLVFEISDLLEGRAAKLYLQSQSNKQELQIFHQSCELVSEWTSLEVEGQTYIIPRIRCRQP